jgi:hypothetical protein
VSKAVLGLSLLDNRVLIESDNKQFLYELARCFDTPLGGDDADPSKPVDLRLSVTRFETASSTKTGAMRVTSNPSDALEGCKSVRDGHPTMLASALNLWAVKRSRKYYAFHAGAVAREGRGILLPAPPGGSKTTLTAALLRRGFDLLSDEVGAMEVDTGRLCAYRRALWLRSPTPRVLGLDASLGMSLEYEHTRIVSAAELGARCVSDSPVLALIISPKYQVLARTRMEPIRAGLAVIALMESSCSQPQFKVAGLDLVIDLALRLPCYRLDFSDLDAAVALIEDAFDRGCKELS